MGVGRQRELNGILGGDDGSAEAQGIIFAAPAASE